ncbi:MAG: DUF378 domain-containing protein [Geobacteraceae bacterium]|nr:DUF378 domain-containing protein [Geobacteraceae bacterium]
MKVLDMVVAALLAIGGLNWGLVGFFDFNLISALFGEASVISRVIYALIGFGALYEVGDFAFGFKAMQDRWCETATVKH